MAASEWATTVEKTPHQHCFQMEVDVNMQGAICAVEDVETTKSKDNEGYL